jgi:hypothetical protein
VIISSYYRIKRAMEKEEEVATERGEE